MRLKAVEGNTQKLDGGALFGNAPREMWKRWHKPDERNRIAMAARTLWVQTDNGRNFLFDMGVGAFFDPQMRDRYGVVESDHVLLRNLEALGLREEDIHGIVLSHLHFDHAGGVLRPYGEERGLLFPNATYYTGKAHWPRACKPHLRDRASFIEDLPHLLESSGRLVLLDEEGHPDLDFVTFQVVNGHTPGLLIPRLNLASGPLVLTSDLIPGISWMHLPITMGYDRYPELTVEEKDPLLEEMVNTGGKFFFTHDPSVPCAAVVRDEKGRYTGQPVAVENLA